jgi:formylglycine-generating enzyme required for sulfatase activity
VSGSLGINSRNLVADGTCDPAFADDAMLGLLADNGGDTLTHALLPGSPAIDAVPAVSCTVPTDQRGALRPIVQVSADTPCDIGAFEVQTAAETTPMSTRAPGETWLRPSDGMTMVYVPAGEFVQGSDKDAVEYARELCKAYTGDLAQVLCVYETYQDERPAHRVMLDGFWIDRTEVTNGQYRLCADAGRCLAPEESGSFTRETYYGDGDYDDYPVVWVTWQQASDYCAWAGGRLPGEAEWEYAARGPENRVFPWGDAFDGTRLNYCDSNCEPGHTDETVDDGHADTAPVGSYPKGVSWCGAWDLAGNAREWVADWFGEYAVGRQVNPRGPAVGHSRIPRGGCWLDRPDDARSANRGGVSPDYTRHKVGFRCARDAGPVTK